MTRVLAGNQYVENGVSSSDLIAIITTSSVAVYITVIENFLDVN